MALITLFDINFILHLQFNTIWHLRHIFCDKICNWDKNNFLSQIFIKNVFMFLGQNLYFISNLRQINIFIRKLRHNLYFRLIFFDKLIFYSKIWWRIKGWALELMLWQKTIISFFFTTYITYIYLIWCICKKILHNFIEGSLSIITLNCTKFNIVFYCLRISLDCMWKDSYFELHIQTLTCMFPLLHFFRHVLHSMEQRVLCYCSGVQLFIWVQIRYF